MMTPQVERVLGILLVAVGVLFYVLFGVLKGSPLDVGPYAIAIVPLVIGLGLIWRASGGSSPE